MNVNKQVQVVIYDEVLGKTKILLVKKLDLKNYTLHWRLLKGSMEENEDERKALAREIFEEVGLSNVQIGRKIYEYDFEFLGTTNKVQTFDVHADSSQALKIQTSEIADASWVSMEDARKILYWKHEKAAVEEFVKYHQ